MAERRFGLRGHALVYDPAMAGKKVASPRGRKPGLDATTRIGVLYGSEPMLKRQYIEQLVGVMRAAHGDVATINFNGEEAELADVLDELRSYGLMQQYKLVIVDEADQFVMRYRDAMLRYAAAPVDHGTLVFRSVRWNRGKLDAAIKKVGCLIKCEPLTRPEASKWLISRTEAEHGRKINSETAMLLVNRLGVDLMRLDAEVAKLVLLLDDQQPITRELIDEVVGRGSDDQAWAVQQQLMVALTKSARSPSVHGASRSGAGAALATIHNLIDVAGQPDILVAYFVADMIRKLHLALMMREQGASEGQIAGALKIWPRERQSLFMAMLRRLDARSTAALFDQIVEADARAKSGRGTALRNLERFCVCLADKME
jgi:DNA polymerase-3 subunit delta